jgi:lipopolysaccharide export system permease protein
MRSPRTLSKSVMREVLSYTALGLLAITTVMVTQNLFRFLDEMISARVSWSEFGSIVGCLGLMLATYTVPIAFLFGVLLTFGRLSSDSEIVAMQSCGLGLPALFQSILILGVAASGFTAYLTLEVEHKAQLALRRAVKTMAVRGGFIEPGRFQHMGERMLFIRQVDADNRLEGVLISDRSDPEKPLMIFAEYGKLHWDSERGELELLLNNGDIHIVPPVDSRVDGDADDSYQKISFLSFDYTLDAVTLFGRHFSTLRPREMSMAQLRDVIARAEAGESLEGLRRLDPVSYQLQVHRRVALPFAPLLFAFVGGLLGLERRRGVRSWGAMICVALVFGYYVMLTFSEYLALHRVLPANIALWIANATFALAAVFLFARASRMQH